MTPPRSPATRTARGLGAARSASPLARRRGSLVVLAGVVVLGGREVARRRSVADPQRRSLGHRRSTIEHCPAVQAGRIATDLALPHVWDIVGAFVEPAQRNGPPLGQVLFGTGAVHVPRGARRVRRRRACWVSLLGDRASSTRGWPSGRSCRTSSRQQTVPIVAIAPLIVVGLRAGWLSVAIIAAYLTFFPVTIAALRGLRSRGSASVRADALVRGDRAARCCGSCGCRRRCRTCSRRFADRGERRRHRRDHRRAAVGDPGRARAARSSTSTSTTRRARRSCGRRS